MADDAAMVAERPRGLTPRQVRDVREALGLSIERMADALGIRPSMLHNVERGTDRATLLMSYALQHLREHPPAADCPACDGRGMVVAPDRTPREPAWRRCEACGGVGMAGAAARVVL